MNIEELKNLIESDLYNGMPIIFTQVKQCPFIAYQYIHQIKKDNKLEVRYVTSVEDIPVEQFFNIPGSDKTFYVCELKNDKDLKDLDRRQNCAFLLADKSSNLEREDAYVVEIPKLQDWQVIDYIKSRLPGIEDLRVQQLITLTESDLFAIEKEIDKITAVTEEEQPSIIQSILEGRDSYTTIFEVVGAILKRDKSSITRIYNAIQNMNISPFALLSLLYTNYRNMIKVHLSPNPTPENTGLKPNQFWAIKKSYEGLYTKEQLVTIFKTLISLEREIKEGRIPTALATDYLLVRIFGV